MSDNKISNLGLEEAKDDSFVLSDPSPRKSSSSSTPQLRRHNRAIYKAYIH